MDEGKIRDLGRVLTAYGYIDKSHDYRLIDDDDFNAYILQLNDKAHEIIAALFV